MFLRLKNYLKKNKTNMALDETKLMSLMQNFTGQSFQWIKTNDATRLGKVVKCRDIRPLNNGEFSAVFDDGSSVNTSMISRNLLMIHGDMQPLTMDEVHSINGPIRPPVDEVKKEAIPIPKEFEEFRTKVEPTPIVDQTRVTQPTVSVYSQQVETKSTNMFEMFTSDNTQLALSLAVKLPDRKLLKMMYTNAENKDKFLTELSEYLAKTINHDIIKEAVTQMLVTQPKKVEVKPTINLTEVE